MVTLTLSNYVSELVSISRVFLFSFSTWICEVALIKFILMFDGFYNSLSYPGILGSGSASDRFHRDRNLDGVIDVFYQIVICSVRSGTVVNGLPWLG